MKKIFATIFILFIISAAFTYTAFAATMEECPVCHGESWEGKCEVCHGENSENCKNCGGSGSCTACLGTGFRMKKKSATPQFGDTIKGRDGIFYTYGGLEKSDDGKTSHPDASTLSSREESAVSDLSSIKSEQDGKASYNKTVYIVLIIVAAILLCAIGSMLVIGKKKDKS